MTELKARIKLMPVHAFVMIFAALYSFVSIFIPMFELFVQYVPFRTYSLFSLLLNPRVFTRIRSGSVNLNFQQFAAWAFVITIVLAVAALTLANGPGGDSYIGFDNNGEPVKNRMKFSQKNIDELEKIVSSISRMNSTDAAIGLILIEEMPAYFSGQKELDNVVKIAQDRAQKVLGERG